MNRTYCCITLIAALMIVGCSQMTTTRPENSSSESATEYGQRLEQKARTLAQAELARLNAIEMVYRNIPMQHSIITPGTSQRLFGWTKIYRRFSYAKVRDVIRSESLLAPIKYKIEYGYEVFATDYRKEIDGPALEQTLTDNRYRILRTNVLHVDYACDESGNPKGDIQEYLPRPKIFESDYLGEIVIGQNSELIQPESK